MPAIELCSVMRRKLFNFAAALSVLLLVLTLLFARWGWLVLSNDGPTALNEQWEVQRMAFVVWPPPSDVGSYNTWKVVPGVYRVDWSQWRRAHQALARRCHYKKRGAEPPD